MADTPWLVAWNCLCIHTVNEFNRCRGLRTTNAVNNSFGPCHVLFLYSAALPRDPTQHDLSSGQHGHPVQQGESYTGMVVELQLSGNMPNTSIAARWHVVCWTTEPLPVLWDLWVIFRDIVCVWCWELKVQSLKSRVWRLGYVWRLQPMLKVGDVWSLGNVPADSGQMQMMQRPQDGGRTTCKI